MIPLLCLVDAKHHNYHHHSNSKNYAKQLRKPFQYSSNHVNKDPYLPSSGIATATYYVEGSKGPNACEYRKTYYKDPSNSTISQLKEVSFAKSFSGPAAALNQRSFNNGAVCGQCFFVTVIGTPTPHNTVKTGKTLKIRIVDECPADASDSEWCTQTSQRQTNPHGAKVHFDMNLHSLPKGWFPERVGTLFLSYKHVQC